MSAGEGDSQRPVTLAIYQKNYEAIFRKSENANICDKSENDNIGCEECLEQSRLLGMSAQREGSLRGKILRMESALLAIANGHDDPKSIAIKALVMQKND